MRHNHILLILIFYFLTFHTLKLFAQTGWQPRSSGISSDLLDIDFISDSIAIAVGKNGTILKSTDAGLNWMLKQSNTVNDLNAVAMHSSCFGIAVGNNATVLITNDCGDTWNGVSFDQGNFYDVIINSPERFSISSDSGIVLTTTNGGIVWQMQFFATSLAVHCLFAPNPQPLHWPYVYALTSWNAFHTLDMSSWRQETLPIALPWSTLTRGNASPFGLLNIIVGSMENPGSIPLILYKTISDTVWHTASYELPGAPTRLFGVSSPSSQICYAVGSGGKIAKSTNGGRDWFWQITPVTQNLSAVAFLTENLGIAVGDSGIILSTTNGGVTSLVAEDVQPVGWALYQNFPNPFNPKTRFQFSIPRTVHVILQIFDVSGREVTILLNERLKAGFYTIDWNNYGLPSGTYFYRLLTDQFIDTKKFVIVK